jgi:hypothetical protein
MRFENPNQQPDKFRKVGQGAYKVGYVHENDRDAITLKFKNEWSNEEMRALFYIQKIAHLIFPEETVAVRQVGSIVEGEKLVNFARTEYVSPEHDAVHQRMQEIYDPADGIYDDVKNNRKNSMSIIKLVGVMVG